MSRRRPRIPGTRRPWRALYLLPTIPDELPSELKDALAIRNACATEGRCPACGAVGEIHFDPEIPGLGHMVFEHEPACPALTDEAA